MTITPTHHLAPTRSGVSPDSASVEMLDGMAVMNLEYGVGIVQEVLKGDYLDIAFGIGAESSDPLPLDAGRAVRILYDTMVDRTRKMKITTPASQVLDGSDWYLAPNSRDLTRLRTRLSREGSTLTLRTSNPAGGRNFLTEELRRHQRQLDRTRFQVDRCLAPLADVVAAEIDWQLQWSLFSRQGGPKLGETVIEYIERLTSIRDGLGKDSWSELVLKDTPPASGDTVMNALTWFIAAEIANAGSSTLVAIQKWVSAIEERLVIHQQVVEGFIVEAKRWQR